MKILEKILTTLFTLLLIVNLAFAEQATYKLTASNLIYTSERILEFDIYLLNSSQEKSELIYLTGQYFFEFNPGIANNGKLTYSLITSTLPDSYRPVNANIEGNQLRLACNSISSINDLPVVSKESPGTLIAKMKLETSSNKFSSEALDLKWSDDINNFRTKLCVFKDGKAIEITNSKNYFADFKTDGNNGWKVKELPVEHSLSSNYPNPFNPVTKISYELPVRGYISMKVYDIEVERFQLS